MYAQLRLDSRIAVITGGSKGLGRAMAESMASAGATVIVTARNEEPCRSCAKPSR